MPITWTEAIVNKKFVVLFLAWLVGLVIFIAILPYFFNNVLLYKPGIQLNDPLFELLPPTDWSWLIFALIFVVPIMFVVANMFQPEKMLLILQCYVVVNFLRILSLYIFTLEAPEGIIPLVDPFLERVAYGGNATFMKDLFFSGHTSTLFIVALAERKRSLRILFIFATVLIGLLLVWQRVHYTIDVIGAIVVTFGVYKGIGVLNRATFKT